jgi:Resolvase, N terminal domain
VIAAIYARKSTDQTGVAEEQKSMTRQVEHARAYALRKGWTVDEPCVFVDDGISGAKFVDRESPGADVNAYSDRHSPQRRASVIESVGLRRTRALTSAVWRR